MVSANLARITKLPPKINANAKTQAVKMVRSYSRLVCVSLVQNMKSCQLTSTNVSSQVVMSSKSYLKTVNARSVKNTQFQMATKENALGQVVSLIQSCC